MPKLAILVVLAAAACNPHNNAVFGSASGGSTASGSVWPIIQIDNVNSSFGSEVGLYDAAGHPTGTRAWVVVLSDQTNFCQTLKANRNFLRQPPTTGYQALILFLPVGRLGTFEVGRPGDEGTSAELIATVPPDAGVGTPGQPPAPFQLVGANQFLTFIALTNWDNGASNGNFDLAFVDPNNTNAYQFSGQYQASSCDGLDGTILP
jgi:hypothetical protein